MSVSQLIEGNTDVFLELSRLPQKLFLPHRIQLMKLLSSKENVTFKQIRQSLNVSDGFLWSHIRALESEGFMKINKEIHGRRVQTTYSITQKGSKTFEEFREYMIKLLQN